MQRFAFRTRSKTLSIRVSVVLLFRGVRSSLSEGPKRNIYETSGAESGWKRPKTVIRGVDLRSIEDTAVIKLLLTRPERKVER